MKKIHLKQGFLAVMTVLLMAAFVTSCDSFSKKRAYRHWSRSITHTFPNTNWAFEEEVLEFPFDIEDTTRFYEVSLSLLFDSSVVTLTDIPLSLTLNTPDGMQSMSKSHFLLDPRTNSDIKLAEDGKNLEATVIVFPRRKLKATGTYKLVVYRRAEKADNYGFISLTSTAKVVK